MIKFILVLFLNIILFFVIFSSSVLAQSCSGVPISGSYTVSSSCAFANTVDGVDAGTGSSNTAAITINSGVTLTISSGQTVAFGSITLNGTIVITKTPSGGQLRKVPLWMTDADVDNYPASTTQTAQATTPASGRRRNLMTSITSTDCNDANGTVYQNLTCYTDDDNDEYGVGAGSSTCSGASCGTNLADVATDCNDASANVQQDVASLGTEADQDGYYTGALSTQCVGVTTSTVSGRTYYRTSSGTYDRIIGSPTGGANAISATADCCDSDSNARPGQTAYFTTARTTCGGFDYDCSGVEDKKDALGTTVPECPNVCVVVGNTNACGATVVNYCDARMSCPDCPSTFGCNSQIGGNIPLPCR